MLIFGSELPKKKKKANINDLISPDWNPRQITEEELQKLETSLNEFGYIEPIIVNDVNNHIVGGNQRCKALKQLGYEEVDVVYVHIEDLAKEKACNVALNKISGDWDNDKLKIVLEEIELSPIDVSLTGFSRKPKAMIVWTICCTFSSISDSGMTPLARKSLIISGRKTSILGISRSRPPCNGPRVE